MTRNELQKRYLITCKGDESIEKKIEKAAKGAKLRVKTNKGSEFGSGMHSSKNGSNMLKKNKRLPEIKRLERDVLQCIIGQDKEDATKYTQEGYYGADVNDMIYNLLENAQNDFERAQNGIIIIDEIDKKAGHGEHDVSGTEVLKSLLKIIEGTRIKIPDPTDPFAEEMQNFDTKNITIIFLGAFSGLDKIRDKRLNKNPLGFVNNPNQEANVQKSRFLKQDLVEYGMPEEFVGRIDTIIEMNKLTKQDLAVILRKSKLSIFRKYQEALREKGISLTYDGKLFELIAEKSLALDTGARELSNTVNYIFENILYDVLANPNKYTNCKLSLEIVEDNTKYELS